MPRVIQLDAQLAEPALRVVTVAQRRLLLPSAQSPLAVVFVDKPALSTIPFEYDRRGGIGQVDPHISPAAAAGAVAGAAAERSAEVIAKVHRAAVRAELNHSANRDVLGWPWS